MARVFSVVASTTRSGSSVIVLSSTSAKTGVAPVMSTVYAVDAKVRGGTITSSPGPTPAATRDAC